MPEKQTRSTAGHAYAVLKVGAYTIVDIGDGKVVIYNEIGEAMDTSKKRLELCLKRFFNREF